MNKIISFVVAFLLFRPIPVWAANSIETAIKKYSLAFPITELGNCNSFDSCREYCQDSSNHGTCVSYAKKKGFYKQEEITQKREEILESAQEGLGCKTTSECKSFCESEANFERCSEFAKKHGLGGGKILSPKNQDILSKAKSILGCDSPSSCKAMCENRDNQEKCKNFMQQAGLKVKDNKDDEQKNGPGGCTSPESCKIYCLDPAHKDECKRSGPSPDGEQEPERPCKGDGECRIYCISNPDKCPGFQAPTNVPGEELCKSGEDCAGKLDPEKGYNPETGKFDAVPPPPKQHPEVQGVSTITGFFRHLWDLFQNKYR